MLDNLTLIRELNGCTYKVHARRHEGERWSYTAVSSRAGEMGLLFDEDLAGKIVKDLLADVTDLAKI